MRGRLSFLVTAAALIGFGAGFLSVDRANAATNYAMKIMGAGDTYMTCGWHGACPPGAETAGVAIDRSPYSNHAFYFRVFMFRSSGSQATVARGTVQEVTNLTCKTVYVNISSPAGGTYRGTAMYTHVITSANGATIDIVGSTGGFWTQSQVGSTVYSGNGGEKSGCPWTGEHVHQRASWQNATGTRNTAVYPNFVNEGTYPIDVNGYEQDRGDWSY